MRNGVPQLLPLLTHTKGGFLLSVANFKKKGKLLEPSGLLEIKMQAEAKTLKEYVQDQIQYQIKCIRKYGMLSHCRNWKSNADQKLTALRNHLST